MAVDIWWYEKRACWCADLPKVQGGRKRHYLGDDEEKARAQMHKILSEYYEAMGDDARAEAARTTGVTGVSFTALTVKFVRWCFENRARKTATSYAASP